MSPTSIGKWAIAGAVISGALISSSIAYAQEQSVTDQQAAAEQTEATASTSPGAAEVQQGSTTDRRFFRSTSNRQCNNCFGVIEANGTILRQKGVTSSTRLATGIYEVLFRDQIGRCAWLATQGLGIFGGVPPAGEIVVTGRAGTNNGLFIQTFNSAGNLTDRAFHVAIEC